MDPETSSPKALVIQTFVGTYKVRNKIEMKRNEINENETKRNQQKRNETKRNQRNETKSTKWKRNETKPTKAKRNLLKQNEIDWYEENGRIMEGKKIKDKTK